MFVFCIGNIVNILASHPFFTIHVSKHEFFNCKYASRTFYLPAKIFFLNQSISYLIENHHTNLYLFVRRTYLSGMPVKFFQTYITSIIFYILGHFILSNEKSSRSRLHFKSFACNILFTFQFVDSKIVHISIVILFNNREVQLWPIHN